jgi:hypothetical protein
MIDLRTFVDVPSLIFYPKVLVQTIRLVFSVRLWHFDG